MSGPTRECLYDGLPMHVDRDAGGVVSWLCANPKCGNTVVINPDVYAAWLAKQAVPPG